ncbi:MAG: hypothetical protein CFE25_12295 [Chitinophagaceae bacterium BSSC1]|nr:MAG: hypothetical protein CFE25_12295 [Chitinophagaceae bacterium BSSC1]
MVLLGLLCLPLALMAQSPQKQIRILHQDQSPRTLFAIQQLQKTLENNGWQVLGLSKQPEKKTQSIVLVIDGTKGIKKEGFQINGTNVNGFHITAADASGLLYGCLEMASIVEKDARLVHSINLSDAPEMVLRGTCIGMQKTDYLPGREVYEYPYTPETFPWFYDKKLWLQYLDSMVSNRLNSLYLWNGHPFASLVRLKEYPYAVEVDSVTFQKNEAIYKFLTEEADKRGIWVIQMFYNIIVSKPFAEYHHIKTQDRNRPIIPLIADYTRKSIAAFVEKYPNVGLMVALGEAMEGVGSDDTEWFTKTIIPGVKDGLRALGKTEEPPIVLRAHDTDAPTVIKAAKPLYSNLYTEAKFNGEALTTYEPRGTWAELHRKLSRSGSVQIENVHILANLEPFRYGSADFIQKSVKSMHSIMEANGLHLYPQASYWDWPYSADKTSPRLLQIERDWLWYKTWSRYAWKAGRDSVEEAKYWASSLASKFGTDLKSGAAIMEAYNQSGQIAPKLLRRFGITDGNRQTLSLGMLMTQLINPYRYSLLDLLYDAESPVGEKLIEYAERDWKKQAHVGETPVMIINQVEAHAKAAVAAIKKAAPHIQKEQAEFKRISNDMICYQLLANHYAQKARAAIWILRYKYSKSVVDLDSAYPHLEKSLDFYRQLAKNTANTYLYANSMQTKQRKIPIRGVDGTFKTWTEVLVPFEQEFQHFKHVLDSLKHSPANHLKTRISLTNAAVTTSANWVNLKENAMPFSDSVWQVQDLAEELIGLKAIQLSFQQQQMQGTKLRFSNEAPIKVLVGFFNKKSPEYLKAPELETDASANDLGQAETKIANAIQLKGLPSVNVHSYDFKAGNNELILPKGACLILGFISGNQPIKSYDAGITEKGRKLEIDWLFE